MAAIQELRGVPHPLTSQQEKLCAFFDIATDRPIAPLVASACTTEQCRSFQSLLTYQNRYLLSQLFIWERITEHVQTYQHEVPVILTLLQHLQDPEKRAWFTDPDISQLDRMAFNFSEFVEVFSVDNWPRIKEHAHFVDWMRLIELCMSAGDTHVVKYQELMNFFIVRPELVKPILELVEERLNWQTAPWDTRLIAFQQIQEYMGIGGVISDTELCLELLARWEPRTDVHQELKANFSTLPNLQQQKILSSLWNGTPIEQIIGLRQHLNQSLPDAQRTVRMNAKAERLLRIHCEESPDLPSAAIRPYFGIEIEAQPPRDGSGTLAKRMGIIGLHMGDGGIGAELELSNGPFKSGLTARTVLENWVDSGLLDLHRAILQTVHLNVGLRSSQVVDQLNDFLITQARIYHPLIHESQRYEIIDSRLRDSAATRTPYFETKGFVVITRDDLMKHMEEYPLLATAANAYEILTLDEHQRHPDRGTKHVAALAEIWLEVVAELQAINDSLGIIASDSQVDLPYLPKVQAILSIFPIPDAHFNANEVLENQPNCIKTARNVSERVCRKIHAILDEVDADFILTKLSA